ncbi:MAG: hypothetical protein WC953_02840 [Pseudomonas sp.]
MDVHARKPQPRTFVVGLLICLITGILLVWRTLVEAETQRNNELLQQETSGLARQLETHFNYQTDAFQRLANRWQHHHAQPALW